MYYPKKNKVFLNHLARRVLFFSATFLFFQIVFFCDVEKSN